MKLSDISTDEIKYILENVCILKRMYDLGFDIRDIQYTLEDSLDLAFICLRRMFKGVKVENTIFKSCDQKILNFEQKLEKAEDDNDNEIYDTEEYMYYHDITTRDCFKITCPVNLLLLTNDELGEVMELLEDNIIYPAGMMLEYGLNSDVMAFYSYEIGPDGFVFYLLDYDYNNTEESPQPVAQLEEFAMLAHAINLKCSERR